MKKFFLLFAMLFIAVANYAEQPANYVEVSQEAYMASDPLMLEGYYVTNTGIKNDLMTTNGLPNDTESITIVVTNPVLSSYNWSVTGSAVYRYVVDRHLCEVYFENGRRGCTVSLSGPLSSTGVQVQKVFGFY